jgi:hypothetical protein
MVTGVRSYLRKERPVGPLPLDLSRTINTLSNEADIGSNFVLLVGVVGSFPASDPFLARRKRKQGFLLTSLVGVAGFEPTASSSRTVIRVN